MRIYLNYNSEVFPIRNLLLSNCQLVCLFRWGFVNRNQITKQHFFVCFLFMVLLFLKDLSNSNRYVVMLASLMWLAGFYWALSKRRLIFLTLSQCISQSSNTIGYNPVRFENSWFINCIFKAPWQILTIQVIWNAIAEHKQNVAMSKSVLQIQSWTLRIITHWTNLIRKIKSFLLLNASKVQFGFNLILVIFSYVE